ncbi:hypothetical protein HDE_11874 [Halotydeus destructor]|nr:hypothetical protein HDE_11874 [Halotydeus destructor]
MVDTGLNFGPEWLRALTDRGPSASSSTSSSQPAVIAVSSPAPKYKLADYRYGREEMLALFDENSTLTDQMRQDFPNLTSEKCLFPLALIDMTEDEHRIWSRSINSEAVIRLQNKERNPVPATVVGSPAKERPAERGGRDAARGGRGALTSDRGRGRGGRGGFFQRNPLLDEEPETATDNREFRKSASDETKPKGFERQTSTRTSEGDEPKGGRKDSKSHDSWRVPSKTGDERGSWRTRTKDEAWAPRPSWRDGRDDEEQNRNGQRRRYNSYTRDWDDGDDENRNLPEWSLEDAGTAVGTFDASGAFREGSPSRGDPDDKNGEWTTIRGGSKHTNNANNSRPEKHDRDRHTDYRDRDSVHPVNHSGNGVREKRNVESPSQSDPRGSRDYVNEKRESAPDSSKFEKQPEANHEVKVGMDDESLNHLEKEAESMVAQWTADEDVHDVHAVHLEKNDHAIPKESAVPTSNENAFKWLYRDPQDQVQGPFSSSDMLDWYTAGYFTPDLLIRRCCDERFCQLGELIKMWDRVPFTQGSSPPPLQSVHQPPPQMSQSMPARQTLGGSLPQQIPTEFQLRQLLATQEAQRQMLQQQQQQLQMQNQLRQLLEHLKSQAGFSDLPQHEQQNILVRQYTQHIEQQKRLQNIPLENSRVPFDAMMQSQNAQFPMSRLPPVPNQQAPNSIWELNGGAITASALEEMQRKEIERKEHEDKQRKMMEEEQRRRLENEEAKRREEEEHRRLIELQREEERRIHEELRRQEEESRKRREEEERKHEEKRLEEQRRRQEEIRRLEEIARKQKEEAERRKMEEEKERERLRQMKMQQELERQRQQQQAELEKQRQAQEMKRYHEPKGWGTPPTQVQPQFGQNLSLAEIQRLQEEKDRDERRKIQFQQQQMQAMYQAQQLQQKQSAQSKQQLTWASGRRTAGGAPVKTLSEIQKEEADKLAKQQRIANENREQQGVKLSNSGIWSNAASQLTWKGNASGVGGVWESLPETDMKPPTAGAGFWEQEARPSKPSGTPNKQVANSVNANSKASNTKKKHEEVVHGLFEDQRRQNKDEFVVWCEEALSSFQSALDVPTFVTFLKELESPFEVNDYVRSYLGENKDSRDFAKQFLEKRSFYRNKSKQQSSQELMWGPAPAITPSVNKSSSSSTANQANTSDNHANDAALKAVKSKKKKAKRVDSSILGFTVQADPDRINVGEIERFD